jgi:hypothetical protein
MAWLIALLCIFSAQPVRTQQPDIIVTAAAVYRPLAALQGASQDEERFPRGAQLLLIHDGNAAQVEPLVTGFAASADANISFDGKRVLFAGKQAATDPWQIWELTLADHSLRKLIAGDSNAILPFYLPAGRLLYALQTAHGYELETAGTDAPKALAPIDEHAGSKLLPLSYLNASAIPDDVLIDGRILFTANYPLGTGATPEEFLVYSDGSGVESYRCDHGQPRWGGKQLSSGDVVFTHGAALARFTSAHAAEARINAPRAEYAGAIAETDSGAWLVSARISSITRYVLKSWMPGSSPASNSVLKTIYAVSGKDIVEPVVIASRTRPKRHPSGLHDWSYANLLALDARQSREGDLKIAPASVRLEAMDTTGHAVLMGTAPVESDGSFFVKVPSDRPIRFALLDGKGAIVRQEHGWFWIRSGEQRICVGCHTGPERASENRVPAVLLRSTTPVDLTGDKPTNISTDKTSGGN